MTSRFERQEALFGEEGQEKLRSSTVAVVGIGGLGSHVVQQLAYLGVGGLGLIDAETLEESNLNRYVSARHWDVGQSKVALGAQMVEEIDPTIQVTPIPRSLLSPEAFDFITEADAVLGCVDDDGVRFILNELCCAYERPYFDLASGVPEPGYYGGRVYSFTESDGCLVCWDALDRKEVDEYIATPDQQATRDGAYGIGADHLGISGPSVVTVNGVVASLGATEFMVWITGLRDPVIRLKYKGWEGKVYAPMPEEMPPQGECYYCNEIRGQGDDADLQRYIRLKSSE